MDRRNMWKIARHHVPTFPASSLQPLVIFDSDFDGLVEDTAPIFDIFKYASEMILDQVHRHQELFSLLKFIADIYGYLRADKDILGNPFMEGRLVVEKLTRQSLECADFIAHYSEKIVFWNKLGKDIDRETRTTIQRFQETLSSLMEQIRRRTFNEISAPIYRGALDVDLSGLEYVTGAGVNESKQCLPGTRREILSTIQDWIHTKKEDATKIFWLSGMAGKGKSAIAHTIARLSHERGSLGSCYCFDRTR
ncbi:uncharacterized protein FIBRA_08359 [Fibroporia radiculosa]|uniref:Nephrocystin 3-like N-terminal domain-containing protein n=1 Tax=Fibroporia radiculosa TaxID=599839 RepID=J4GWN0_9APHY|nr:uncharacterized protein FIBRA_08359 [Fibroporia radiculosa]CCM06110.1 predicted protein [Fibroporia radiculosa]